MTGRPDQDAFEIFDLSRPLEPATAPWPGDIPFELRWTSRMADGEPANVSALSGSPHVGTHVDAPLHVREGAAPVDQLDLGAFLGPARVVPARAREDGLIHPEALAGIDLADPPRILLKTGTHPDSRAWPRRFAALALETAALLAAQGAVLVGIDTPSVDAPEAADLASHLRLLDGGVRWIENLDLSAVEPGLYWLAALPLPIVGADASPVRAVLLRARPSGR